jgi:senataxin
LKRRWDEDTASGIRDFLQDLDIKRISHNVDWAVKEVRAVAARGDNFKKSYYGERLALVHITIYEALCCMPYLADPERLKDFQDVFATLQGKTYLKLGTKDPLPGMTYFMFDRQSAQRRNWAKLNWKSVNDGKPLSEEQFDWAVNEALTTNVQAMQQVDPTQANSETLLEIEQLWQAVEMILMAMDQDLIMGRLQSLEIKPSIYDLLFGHISFCKSEGVLVATIRVLKELLGRSPKAIWDVVGEAKPNVIADLIFANPIFKMLLSQSHENCWTDYDSSNEDYTPFPTSWVRPWLQSLGRDRRYDACDSLMHTLFHGLAQDAAIGVSGQAACVRAGLDALKFTMQSFLDSKTSIGLGTPHYFANATFDLVSDHRDVIMKSANPNTERRQVWDTFRVANAAVDVIQAGMNLDMKLFAEEYLVLNSTQSSQSGLSRKSKNFWESVMEVFDRSSEPVDLATKFIQALSPIVAVEQIRPKKSDANGLEPNKKEFNTALADTLNVLTRIMTRVSELDNVTDLNVLMLDANAAQVLVALSLQGEPDFAEASM